MATGRGRSLGAALIDLFHQGGRPGGERSSYKAKSWHAQLAQLTGTKAGQQALDAAGLDITGRTLRGWLATTQTPTPANQAKIRDAYQIMQGGFHPQWRTAQYAITGTVQQGADVRERGRGGTAPLRIDGRPGDWTHIEQEWRKDKPDPDRIEASFVRDIIAADIGEGSYPWEFPGMGYKVTTM